MFSETAFRLSNSDELSEPVTAKNLFSIFQSVPGLELISSMFEFNAKTCVSFSIRFDPLMSLANLMCSSTDSLVL